MSFACVLVKGSRVLIHIKAFAKPVFIKSLAVGIGRSVLMAVFLNLLTYKAVGNYFDARGIVDDLL